MCVCDVARPAAERVAGEHGARALSDPAAIWTAESIDAVLIASSTDTHVELLREALGAGKAAYCEKPIDFDLPRVRAVVAEAAAADVPVAVGFRRRAPPRVPGDPAPDPGRRGRGGRGRTPRLA